jgi:hypothetical protein
MSSSIYDALRGSSALYKECERLGMAAPKLLLLAM